MIFGDALYYIAEIKHERFKTAPSDLTRSTALDGWRKVRSAYGSDPSNPRFERATREIETLQ
jgi:hypothetical protein